MRIIQSVAPDLSVGLTDDNQLVIMLDSEYGEVMAIVPDIDTLVRKLRHLELIQAERPTTPSATVTTAEVELNRRAQ